MDQAKSSIRRMPASAQAPVGRRPHPARLRPRRSRRSAHYRERGFTAHPRVQILRPDVSLQQATEEADVACTIRSTAGLEAMMMQRPVIVIDLLPGSDCSVWWPSHGGGLADAEYAWGEELAPGGRHMANTWQGDFPNRNLCTDGFDRTSPVTAFPPNGYGVHDMIGNVWEWTSDWYSPRHEAGAPKACCIPENPRGGREDESFDPCLPQIRIPRKVLKGGSHLCAPNYCRRYRPAARHAEAVDTSTSHVGFRCVKRGSPRNVDQGRVRE